MRLLKIILIVGIYVAAGFSSHSIAQPQQSPTSSGTQQAQELQILKAQVASMEKYQSQFISIVLWSLGAVLAMALGLSAFNWYSNKFSYEREIQAIKQASDRSYDSNAAQLKSELEAQSKSILDDLSTREESIRDSVANELNKKMNAQSSNIKRCQRDILSLQFSDVERAAKDAVRDKRFEWALHNYCELLRISVKQGSDYYEAGEILDEMSTLLDKPNIELNSDEVTQLTETLRGMPERYLAAAENLIPKVNNAHT